MGLIHRLPTLAEVNALRRATPKDAIPTRLDVKTAADKDDAQQLEAWRHAVARRDRHRCRVCGCKTVKTLALDPKRGEAHHIVSRTNPVTRTDVRNGIHVCLRDHQRLTRHQLFVVGTAAHMFQAGKTGHWYLDATCALTFAPTKPEAAR